MTTRHTSIDELYTSFEALILSATGRKAWRKTGIQARPKGLYATVYFNQIAGLEKPIVENVPLVNDPDGALYEQIPWCTSMLDCQFAFYSDRNNDTALQAAQRFRASLYLEARFWDVWHISALAGEVQLIDLSLAFREEIESRVEVRFQLAANIVLPAPLHDTKIYEISHQEIGIIVKNIDGSEEDITTEINNDESS